MGPYTIHAMHKSGLEARTKTEFLELVDMAGRDYLDDGAVRVWATNGIGETVLDSDNGDFGHETADMRRRRFIDRGSCSRCGGSLSDFSGDCMRDCGGWSERDWNDWDYAHSPAGIAERAAADEANRKYREAFNARPALQMTDPNADNYCPF